jgi:hypothetical protein
VKPITQVVKMNVLPPLHDFASGLLDVAVSIVETLELGTTWTDQTISLFDFVAAEEKAMALREHRIFLQIYTRPKEAD